MRLPDCALPALRREKADFSRLIVDRARGRHPLPLPINKPGAAGCCWLAGWRASERTAGEQLGALRLSLQGPRDSGWRRVARASRRALRLALLTPDASAEEGRRRGEAARPGLAFVSRRRPALALSLSLAFAVAAHSQQGLSRLASLFAFSGGPVAEVLSKRPAASLASQETPGD